MLANWYAELNLFGLATFPPVSVEETEIKFFENRIFPRQTIVEKSDFSCVEIRFFRKSPLRCGSSNASPEVVHRPGLYFDIRNI